MNTSTDKIINKLAKDPIDKLIYEKGLRIKDVLCVKKQDSLIVFLNNGTTITLKLSVIPSLKKASQLQLDSWKLISKGIGIEWNELDEDISLKGLIKQLIIQNTLLYIGGESTFAKAA
jgi:hypothetical protein